MKKNYAFKYISYRISQQQPKKKNTKPSELYIDNCGYFGSEYHTITSFTSKQKIAESDSITRSKENIQNTKWKKDKSIFKGIEHVIFNFYEHVEKKRVFTTHIVVRLKIIFIKILNSLVKYVVELIDSGKFEEAFKSLNL